MNTSGSQLARTEKSAEFTVPETKLSRIYSYYNIIRQVLYKNMLLRAEAFSIMENIFPSLREQYHSIFSVKLKLYPVWFKILWRGLSWKWRTNPKIHPNISIDLSANKGEKTRLMA